MPPAEGRYVRAATRRTRVRAAALAVLAPALLALPGCSGPGDPADGVPGREPGEASGTRSIPAESGGFDSIRPTEEEQGDTEAENGEAGSTSRTAAAGLNGVAARLDSQSVQLRAVSARTESLHQSMEGLAAEVRRLRTTVQARPSRSTLGTAFLAFLLGAVAASLPGLLRRWRSRDGGRSAPRTGLLAWLPWSRDDDAAMDRRTAGAGAEIPSGEEERMRDAHTETAGVVPRLDELLRRTEQTAEERVADRRLLQALAGQGGSRGGGGSDVLDELLRRADRAERERERDRETLEELAERARRTEAWLARQSGRGAPQPAVENERRAPLPRTEPSGGRGDAGMGMELAGLERDDRDLPRGNTGLRETGVQEEDRLQVQLNEEGIFVPYPEPVNRPMAELRFHPGETEPRAYILTSFLFGMNSRRLQLAYNVDLIDSGRYDTITPAQVDWSDGPGRGRVRTKGKLRYIGS
jgi:hypothetical protein